MGRLQDQGQHGAGGEPHAYNGIGSKPFGLGRHSCHGLILSLVYHFRVAFDLASDDGLKADSVKINITTELNVINNNADEVVGNVYTWYINDSNYQNKTVEITLEKAFQIEDVLPQSEASYLTFIIVAVIILVALIIILFVKHKAKKNNNI